MVYNLERFPSLLLVITILHFDISHVSKILCVE